MLDPILPVALAVLAACLLAFRFFCLKESGQWIAASGSVPAAAIAAPAELVDPETTVIAGVSQLPLRPAELAYLVREGDRSHATIVMAFDLLHRAVKSLQSGSTVVSLAPYEKRMFEKVKEFAKRWLDEKTSQIIPDPRSRDVRLIVRQVSGLYMFLFKSVRPFVAEILEDPRRIRRYFTVAGLMRLLADLGSAGYREALETEMVADMMSRGLLMPEPARKRASTLLTAGLVVGFALALAIVLLTIPNQPLGVLIFVTSGIVALAVRLAWGVREFLPMYSELTDVDNHIQRPGWRLVALRFLLKLVGGILYSIVAIVGLLFLALQILCLHLVFAAPLTDTVWQVLMLLAVWLCLLELAFDAYKMRRRAQPSLQARALIADSRKRLAAVSPVESFRELLVSRDYSPQCSELLAIYGIETLFVLA